jgi:hypothetical protein
LGKRNVAQSIDTHSGAKDVEFLTQEFSAFRIGHSGNCIAVPTANAKRDGAGTG